MATGKIIIMAENLNLKLEHLLIYMTQGCCILDSNTRHSTCKAIALSHYSTTVECTNNSISMQAILNIHSYEERKHAENNLKNKTFINQSYEVLFWKTTTFAQSAEHLLRLNSIILFLKAKSKLNLLNSSSICHSQVDRLKQGYLLTLKLVVV